MKKDPKLNAPHRGKPGKYSEEFRRFCQTIQNASTNPADDKNTHRNTIYDRFLVHRFGTKNRAPLTDIAETAAAIRLKLLQQDHRQYIYDEYVQQLRESNDRPGFFWAYFETVFKKNREYLRDYYSKAVVHFLDLLPENQRFAQSRRLIEYEPYIFSQTVMRRVVEEFEKAIPAARPGDEELFNTLKQVTELKTNRKLTTPPVITAHLPSLPRLAETPDQHAVLFKWFETTSPGNRQRLEFIHGYIDTICRMIKEKIKENDSTATVMFSSFLAYYFSRQYRRQGFTMGSEKNRSILIMTLAALPASQFGEIRKKLIDAHNDAPTDNENSTQNEMHTLLDTVRKERRKSFFRRFTGFFTRHESIV